MSTLILFFLINITFEKTFGEADTDVAYSCEQTTDGGYIISGSTTSFGAGNLDVWVIKTDSMGNIMWSRTFGNVYDEEGISVKQTRDGGYIIAGYSDSININEPQDVYLLKLDSLGNHMWSKFYGDTSFDWGQCVQQTSDGGYIVSGNKDISTHIYLIKTDSTGDTLWTRTLPGAEGRSVIETDDGGYMVAGFAWGSSGTYGYIIRTDLDGNVLWIRSYGGNWDVFWEIQKTQDSNYIVVGSTGSNDVWLLKINPDGDTIWERTFGGAQYDGGTSVQQTPDGGYVIAGSTNSFGAGGADVYLIKADSLGNLVWQKTFGGDSSDRAWCVRVTSDGGFVIVGNTKSFGMGNYDVYFIKTDSLGNIEVEEAFNPVSRDLKLSITPIFFRDNLILNLHGEKSLLKISIYDLKGSKVFEKNIIPQKRKIIISEIKKLNSGIYFISVYKDGEKIKDFKVMKF